MNKLNKFLFAFLLIISFTLNVRAEETKKETAVDKTKEYCKEEETKKETGCIFNENNTMYTQSGKSTVGLYDYGVVTSAVEQGINMATLGGGVIFGSTGITHRGVVNVEPDLPLSHGYTAVDENGNIVFAGCYKGYVESTFDLNSKSYHSVKLKKDKTKDNSNVAYYFKIYEPVSGKSCPENNTKYDGIYFVETDKFDFGGGYSGAFATDGKELNKFNVKVGVYDWTPTADGSCPQYFNYRPEVNTFLDSKNRFVFSNNAEEIGLNKNTIGSGISLLFKVGNYELTVTGCTEEDTENSEKLTQCFENIKTEINNGTGGFSCPSDLNSIDFKTTLKNKIASCNDVKSKNANSARLEEKGNSEYSSMLNSAVKDRIELCYVATCVSNSSLQQQILNKVKSANCESKCTTSSETISSTCTNCYKSAYQSVNSLTETQVNCLVSNIESKVKSMNDTLNSVNDTFDKLKEDNLNNADSTRDTVAANSGLYTHFEPGGMGSKGFGKSGGSCTQILGSNGTKLVNGLINALRIAGAIIAIINAMLRLIPAVIAKDADGLKKATNTCVKMAVILAVIGLFPTVIRLIGRIFGYDISCIL